MRLPLKESGLDLSRTRKALNINTVIEIIDLSRKTNDIQ